jgi:hypothetical protein
LSEAKYDAGLNDSHGYVQVELVASPNASLLYGFSGHRFTPCGTSGQSGPSLSSCTTRYPSWASNTSYLSVPTQGYQLWTVPQTGTYRITAAGAQGGDNGNSGWLGSTGAIVRGDFTLTKGDQIRIVVGQRGLGAYAGNSYYNMSGGGGGSYVVAGTSGTSSPLIIAGGGGGATSSSWNSCGAPSTQASRGGGQAPGVGPYSYYCPNYIGDYGRATDNGYGGGSSNWGYAGCPGGGLYGNASCSTSANWTTASGGVGFANGATGGNGDGSGSTGTGYWGAYAYGGFGGGGGGALGGSGGGGGYTGGVGHGQWSSYAMWGSGGSSYNAGSNQWSQSGSGTASYYVAGQGNAGDGWVTVELIPQ